MLSGAFCFSRPIVVVGVRISDPRLCLLNPTLLRFRKPDVAVGAAVSLKLTQPSGSGYNCCLCNRRSRPCLARLLAKSFLHRSGRSRWGTDQPNDR